jgi:hypothetical protein
LADETTAKTANGQFRQASAPASPEIPDPSLPPSRSLTLHTLPLTCLPSMSRIYRQDPKRSSPPLRSTTTTTWSSDDEKWPAPSLSHLMRTIRRKLAFWNPSGRSNLTHHSRTSSLSPVPSPATFKFILQCCIWYASSAMSSNTGKSIMNRFRYPVTLTFVQFFFVASFCALFMSPLVRFSKFRPPTRAIFNATLPMGAFQVGGHIFSSMAISRIPVSTVHTIKVPIHPPLLSIS